MEQLKNCKKSAIIDIIIMSLCFVISFPLFMYFYGQLGNISEGLKILFRSLAQFCTGGLGILIVIILRKESLKDYGISCKNIGKSVKFGLITAIVYIIFKSAASNTFLIIPMKKMANVQSALTLGFPFNILGIVLTFILWGVVEGFFYIALSKKIDNAVGIIPKNIWLSPGPIIFAVINEGLVHQGFFGGTDILQLAAGLLVSYFIALIPRLTKNAWGGILLQTIQNGLGPL